MFVIVFLMLFLVMVTLASLSACIIYLIAQQEDGDINSLLSNAIMIYEGYPNVISSNMGFVTSIHYMRG